MVDMVDMMTLCTSEDHLSSSHFDMDVDVEEVLMALAPVPMQEVPRYPHHIGVEPYCDAAEPYRVAAEPFNATADPHLIVAVPHHTVAIPHHTTAEPHVAEPARIRDCEIDSIYASLEEDAMMSILADLESELTPVYMAAMPPAHTALASAQEALLWNVIATPTMMRDFGAHVAATQARFLLPEIPVV